AEDLEAFLPGEVAVLPAWEALPYEGISPAPDVAARRAAAVRRLRDAHGATVVVAPALAAMQGLVPTLGTTPALELVAGREPPPGRPRGAPRRARLPARGRGRAARRVRRAGRGRGRLPRRRPPAGPPRVLGRRDRVDP